MIRTIIVFLFALVLVVFIGCNKSEDDVNKLEQEALETEAVKAASDSLAIANAAVAVEMEEETLSPEEELASRRYEAAGTGGFTVQIGSGTTRLAANYDAEQYIARGYEAFVSEVYIDDVSYFRIRIGNLETYEEATRLGEELKDKFSVDYWIDNNI